MTSKIEKISHQIDPSNINSDMFGTYSKMELQNIKNPTVTKFRSAYDKSSKFTNYLYVPKNITVDKKDILPVTTIKISNKDCHVLTNLNIYLNYNETVHPHDVEKISMLKNASIKLKQKDTILFDFDLADIENIMKMHSCHSKFIKHSVKQKKTCKKALFNAQSNILYYIPLQKLLQVSTFILFDEPLEIEIKSQEDLTSIEVYYDGYVLTKAEYSRYETCGLEAYIYQYKTFDILPNQVNQLKLSNNIIIDKILVSGNSIISANMSYDDIDISFLNTKSMHNKVHKECGIGSNDTYYYFSDNIEIHTCVGKLFPSETKNMMVVSKSNEKCRLYIQYANIMQFSEGITFMFDSEYNEKEYLFNKYIILNKSSHDTIDIIKEIKEKTNVNPLTHESDNLYHEGYWFGSIKSNNKYPIPIATQTKNSDEFITNLKLYMSSTDPIKSYFGSSNCRICDKHNGSTEYEIRDVNSEKIIVFPEGLLHYYEYHNVVPSNEFYDIIIKLEFV
jgi:hypothetical protein